MKYKPVIVMLWCLLAGSASAQQDPLDLGEADTAFFVISEPTVGAVDQLVTAELYFRNDVQSLSSVAFGFGWDNPNFQMESVVWSPEAVSAFNMMRIEYYRNNIDSTNANLKFQCVAMRVSGDGLVASDQPKLVVTYTFKASSWSESDRFCIDIEDFSTNAFVDLENNEYLPIWPGPFCVGNVPIGFLEVTPTILNFSGVVGEVNPPAQMVEITSDQDPLSFDLIEDISWLLKSPSSGVTPQEISISVTSTGLAAATYFDSVRIESAGAANSPQFLFVEFDLTPSLPEIAVNREAFYFNALAGGDNPPSQTLLISNIGQSVLNWSVSNHESWLNLDPVSGTGAGTVTLSVSTAGLTFGEYHDTVVVSDPMATNSPVLIPSELLGCRLF